MASTNQTPGRSFLPPPDPMIFFLSDVIGRLQEAHASGQISDNDMEILLQKARANLVATKDLFTCIVLALIQPGA